MLIDSSVVISFDNLLSLGGGDGPFAGGVADLRDLLEPRDGVRKGVSCGVGREAAAGVPPSSSSVSHTAMLKQTAVEHQWGRLRLLSDHSAAMVRAFMRCEQ